MLFADTTHVVQKGDTLYSISKKYNTTIQSIIDANKINGNDIKAGQKLIIPGAVSSSTAASTPAVSASKNESYTVKKGDTWYGIARTYSVSVKDLYALNGTDGSQGLKIGQVVKVPGAAGSNSKSSGSSTVKTPAKPAVTPVSVPAIVDTHSYSGKKGDPNLVWPVEKPEVAYLNGKVSGVTLRSKKDEAVNSIKAGTVMFSGTYRGFGNVVFIQSKTGHIYAYTGLGKVLVSKGEYIDYKTQIGTAGIDSYSSKPQISLMVFQNGLPIDPAKAPRG